MICFKCKKAIEDEKKAVYGLHKECFADWFGFLDSKEFTGLSRKETDSDVAEKEPFSQFNSSFFQGKFRKYSASLNGVDYILKVEEKEYPELPATEYLCNQIARSLKIKVPDFYFIDFHGKKTFVSKNFINKNRIMALRHIYHYLSADDLFDVKTLTKVIEIQTGELSEVERFVRLSLFDALIGNHDRHGRNLAFIEEPGNKPVLSPFYDNPAYIGVEEETLLGAHHSPKGKIATSKTEEPSMKDYAVEFIDMGYADQVIEFMNDIKVNDISAMVSESFISKRRSSALMKIINERTEELKNVL